MFGSDETLDQVRSLRRRIESLEGAGLRESLEDFQLLSPDGALVGYTYLPRTDQHVRQSIASTATCLKARERIEGVGANNKLYSDWRSVSNNWLSRINERWFASGAKKGERPIEESDTFTVAHALLALKIMGPAECNLEVLRDEGAKRISKILEAKKNDERGDPDSGYTRYLLARSLNQDGSNGAQKVKLREQSSEVVNRQIRYAARKHEERFEPFELGYHLIVLSILGEDTSSLTQSALGAIFDSQLERGVWEKKVPVVYFELGKPDAYCFAFEFLAALLTEYQDKDRLFELLPFANGLERAFNWAERNVIISGTRRQWCANYVNLIGVDPRPESWATAEVHLFLRCYKAFLAKVASRAFDRMGVLVNPIPRKREASCWTFARSEVDLENVISTVAKSRHGSGILFGPPGTGKTFLVGTLAAELNWPLVTITPAEFAARGMDNVASEAAKCFRALGELDEAVILFDEMDVLINDRTGGFQSFAARFLTNAMLPLLQNLNERKRCIVILATNFARSLDSAATREGRFDFCVPVLPTHPQCKLAQVEGLVAEGKWTHDQLDAFLKAVDARSDRFLESVCDSIERLKEANKESNYFSDVRIELADAYWRGAAWLGWLPRSKWEPLKRSSFDDERSFDFAHQAAVECCADFLFNRVPTRIPQSINL